MLLCSLLWLFSICLCDFLFRIYLDFPLCLFRLLKFSFWRPAETCARRPRFPPPSRWEPSSTESPSHAAKCRLSFQLGQLCPWPSQTHKFYTSFQRRTSNFKQLFSNDNQTSANKGFAAYMLYSFNTTLENRWRHCFQILEFFRWVLSYLVRF